MSGKVQLNGAGPVVMVDDNEVDAFLAKRCYERAGLPNVFVHLKSADELLGFLRETRGGTKPMPSIVLLDINMPGTDGFEALTAIRTMSEFHTVPVIMMLTNSDDPRDAEQALQSGANGFATKPPDVNAYVTFFKSLLAA